MAKWHRSWRGDVALRVAGLLLGWISCGAFRRLAAMEVPHHAAGLFAYALAAIGFLAASGGGAMLMLGRHLFDRIEVSARWRSGT